MIWRFGKKQLSDVVKIQQFLEKENIDYELLLDHVDVRVGEGQSLPTADLGPRPVAGTPDHDPLWRVAEHDGIVCREKSCKEVQHYGAEAL